MTQVIQSIIDATALGSIVALFALGIALVFGVMRVVNLAHGEIIMAAGYTLVITNDWPWVARIVAAILVGVLVAMALQVAVFRPMKGANAVTIMVGSLAAAALLQNSALLWQGPTPKGVSPLSSLGESTEIAGIHISNVALMSVVVTAVLLLALTALFKRTSLGLRIRAAAEDFEMARLMGIRGNAVGLAAFAIAGVLAAAGGILLVSQTGTVTPMAGLTPMLLGLIGTIVGGMGRLDGAVVGGFVLGAATVLLQVILPLDLRPYRDAILFTGVLLLILVRPEGLLRSAALTERV